jgi:hypothetical protein
MLAHRRSRSIPVRVDSVEALLLLLRLSAAGNKEEELGSWDVIDYFLYTDARLLPLCCASSGNDL